MPRDAEGEEAGRTPRTVDDYRLRPYRPSHNVERVPDAAQGRAYVLLIPRCKGERTSEQEEQHRDGKMQQSLGREWHTQRRPWVLASPQAGFAGR